MKKLLMVVMAFSLLLLPLGVDAQLDQKSAIPPVSQSLVPEGDFALKLVAALKLGTPGDEAQAEDMLSSAGITPKNGWIADYPVTPIIVGELQSAVVAAADAQRLPMAKDDALKAFQDATAESGLAVVPGDPGQYAGNQPQPDPMVINNYYYEEGPPVVTYYPPSWDYDYLYSWVPYPFWYTGFFFPGFFILHDFHRSIFVGHRLQLRRSTPCRSAPLRSSLAPGLSAWNFVTAALPSRTSATCSEFAILSLLGRDILPLPEESFS